ncbi:aspartate/glutamate racemase family protein [Campylobacter sp. FMV-PI01]|uniref:Aspartate/glutamate racemase family protein n=1 Tax=Campylobacter portucalensis TaxID=2608384 RepID=A0A6L5WKW5_9BACT|nr:amino acid racemase [Campylobacter portucalensis]MSN97042.1 aspartate/glutamate racemase family protein [Campylobacter portucalensis]
MKRVGIIGGMGSLASVDLYKKIVSLTPAKCDQDHILITIDNNAKIPDRSAYIFRKDESVQNPLPFLIDSVKRLENSGCDGFCIACNTAHFFADELVKYTKMKFLNMPQITTKNIKNSYPNAKKVAVIATIGTRKTGIYNKFLDELGLESIEISNQIEQNIMDCIYKGVKAGRIDEYKEIFRDSIKKIEADVFIAACTEIPILMQYLDDDSKFVDATNELAKEVVEFANS